jgi:hypothetical protein
MRMEGHLTRRKNLGYREICYTGNQQCLPRIGWLLQVYSLTI